MPDPPSQAGGSTETPQTGADEARRCVACGYNLFGLGEEPRCPECGLLNIPSHFREQVWEFVDSGRWFFSGFFSPFRKRLPGWWWALDRPGDVRRSFRFVCWYVAVAALLIFGAGFVADSICVEVVYAWSHQTYRSPNDPTPPSIIDTRAVSVFGLMGLLHEQSRHQSIRERPGDRNVPKTVSSSFRILVDPSFRFLLPSGCIFLWVFFSWAGPAMVGLWTQIRKGLPEFARAPRTIMAAGNYEAHRLVYLGMIVALWMATEVVVRTRVISAGPAAGTLFLVVFNSALVVAVSGFAAAGWVGPLRSDYTRQLVRSRLHAARIVIMYAFLVPHAMAMIVAGCVQLLFLS